jgi:hypothetical protein
MRSKRAVAQMGTLEKFVLIEDCKKQIDYIMLLSYITSILVKLVKIHEN